MDMHSNIRDLHNHRDEIETSGREHPSRGEVRVKTAPPKANSIPTTFGSGWYHDAAIEASAREAIEARCHPVHW